MLKCLLFFFKIENERKTKQKKREKTCLSLIYNHFLKFSFFDVINIKTKETFNMNSLVEEKLKEFYTKLLTTTESADKHFDGLKEDVEQFIGLLGKFPTNDELNDLVKHLSFNKFVFEIIFLTLFESLNF